MKSRQMNDKRRFLVFFIAMGIITVVFAIILTVTLTDSLSLKSYDKIVRKGLTIEGNKLFTLDSGEYYIFVYSSDENNSKINRTKQENLEIYIVNYFDFYKDNEKKYKDSICPIRLMDVDQTENKRCLDTETSLYATSWTNFTVREQDLPVLIDMTVTNGKYSYTVYTTEMSIKQELQSTIGLVNVAYAPILKKEEEF